jgi:ribosome assembly protein 4
MCRTVEGHAHWVNTLALSSDYIIRTGAFDPKDAAQVKAEKDLTSNKIKINKLEH